MRRLSRSRFAVAAIVVALALTACSGSAATRAANVGARLIIGAENATEFAAVFGDDAVRDADEVVSAAQWLAKGERGGLTVVRPGTGTAAEYALEALTSSSGGVATIIGHNENGVLRFADGSGLIIANLPVNGPRIAVISCSSQKYVNGNAVGLTVDLNYSLALRTEELFTQRVATLTPDEAADTVILQRQLDEAFDAAAAEFPDAFAFSLAITGSAAVVGVSILAIDLSD
jgi:hypothetical protein